MHLGRLSSDILHHALHRSFQLSQRRGCMRCAVDAVPGLDANFPSRALPFRNHARAATLAAPVARSSVCPRPAKYAQALGRAAERDQPHARMFGPLPPLTACHEGTRLTEALIGKVKETRNELGRFPCFRKT